MKPQAVKSFLEKCKNSQEYEIKIGDKITKVKLRDDINLKELKSFLLTFTDSEPFFL
jgi:hypothetical protein